MMKKGQTAFLATLLLFAAAALIATGLFFLAHYEIFHVKNLLPSSCTFSKEVKCTNHILKNDGFAFQLTSQFKQPVVLTKTIVERDDQTIICDISTAGKTWLPKEEIEVINYCDFTNISMVPNFKHEIDISLKYYQSSSGPNFEKAIKGKLFAKFYNISIR